MVRMVVGVVALLSLACLSQAFDRIERVNVGEVSLSVGVSGSSNKKMVLLHGFPEGRSVWEDHAPLFVSNGYQVIAPDLRGYNDSDCPEEVSAYDVNKLAEDVHQLIVHYTKSGKGKQTVILVAHDWGGQVAWIVGHKFPHLLDGLVIQNSPHPNILLPLMLNDPEQQTAAKYLNLFVNHQTTSYYLLSSFGYKGAYAAWGTTPVSEQLKKDLLVSWEKSLPSQLKWYPANVRIPSSFSFKDMEMFTYPKVCDVHVPTMIQWGAADVMYLEKNLQGMEELVPDLTIVRYEDGTHFVNVDKPVEITNDILKFAEAAIQKAKNPRDLRY
eukprot:GILJ01003179.1.p1 GENE.GILJ01003179.1~~GILJ01003179.1.p1  ORF type:complete len:340 (+),score=59.04 GILJ01003179.1:42-1022(+)